MAHRKMLINAAQSEETRVAITENGQLIDMDIELKSRAQKKANIYKAKISRVEPSLNAVFVDYGAEKHGFLPIKEVSHEYFENPSVSPFDDNAIHQVKAGQEIIIQIDKEERGTKGAAVTTYITLAGCYMVLMPNNPRAGGISRRIEGDERQQLREISRELRYPKRMGAILRTACLGRSLEELQWDMDTLLKTWDAIQEAFQSNKKAPFLIYQESDVILRSVRDYLKQDINEIIVDTEEAYQRVLETVKRLRPDFADRVKLELHNMPLFTRHRIEKQIETAYAREITLPSGGSIVIDHTEALTSVDINSAKATKGADIEATALNTNIEAAHEVAKQLRLRDLGGLIVIDFIDMYAPDNQREVENQLTAATRADRARIQIGRISQFGLLEMSRQRLQPSLGEATTQTCPRCNGHGTIRSIESVALLITRKVRELVHQKPGVELIVQTSVEIATFLLNEKRLEIDHIEQSSSNLITIIPNRHMESPHYSITVNKHFNKEHHTQPSYLQAKAPNQNIEELSRSHAAIAEAPAVAHIEASNAPQTSREETKKEKPGILANLWKSLFGTDQTPAKEKERDQEKDKEKQKGKTKHKNGQNTRSNGQSTRTSNGAQKHRQKARPPRTAPHKPSTGKATPLASSTEKTHSFENQAKTEQPIKKSAQTPKREKQKVAVPDVLVVDDHAEKAESAVIANANTAPKKETSLPLAPARTVSVEEKLISTPSKKSSVKRKTIKLPEGAVLTVHEVIEPILANLNTLTSMAHVKTEIAHQVKTKVECTLPSQTSNLEIQVINI